MLLKCVSFPQPYYLGLRYSTVRSNRLSTAAAHHQLCLLMSLKRKESFLIAKVKQHNPTKPTESLSRAKGERAQN